MSPDPVDILIVDDSPVKLLALETALGPLGQRLHKARSGREALRQILQNDFAVVILDVHMPGMDGFETAECIRGRERSAATPIIFISAVSQTEAHAFRGYALGAVDYVFAPFVPEVLRAKVSVFVELHRRSVEVRRMADRIAEHARELADSQDRLRQTERLAAVGTLAAGLGHDMGNLLLPIRFRLEAIQALPIPGAAREDLAAIRGLTDYLHRLAHGLGMLAVDRDQDSGDEPGVDLRRWWDDFMPVLRSALPKAVVLEDRLESTRPAVRIAEHRLCQAVFNLVQNAGNALAPRGAGRVCVWSRDRPGAWVDLGVTDDGPGMSEEVRRRCLDPFFTTRTRQISSGLGLSLVRAITARAGGTLLVESAPGRGATFTLRLPASGPGAPRPGRSAHVSVGDPRVAGFVRAVLASGGWEVREGAPPADSAARVWVTDTPVAGAVEAFCGAGPDRRAVVLDGRADGAAAGRVIHAGEEPGVEAIRRALAAACTVPTDSGKDPSDANPGAVRGRQRVDRRVHRAPVEGAPRV